MSLLENAHVIVSDHTFLEDEINILDTKTPFLLQTEYKM